MWGLVSIVCCAFEEDWIPCAAYAVDSVAVNAGTFWNTVTGDGPSVPEGAAAGVSEELEEGVGEVEDFAAALEAGAWEEEDVEDAAVGGKNGCLAKCRVILEAPSVPSTPSKPSSNREKLKGSTHSH